MIFTPHVRKHLDYSFENPLKEIHNIYDLVWFGLVGLFKQGKPLASGYVYYSRPPVKYSITKGQKHNNSEIPINKSHADSINIKGKDHVSESK